MNTRMLPKPPTDEQFRASALRWQEIVGPLCIDKWPPKLLALSAPTIFLEFPLVLADEWWHQEQKGWSETANQFAAEIDKACDWEMKFFRLNSRSPKDATWPLEALLSCSGRMMLHIMRSSERMLDDLVRFKWSDITPILCLREDMHCDPGRELRVFMQDGVVKAVAEYGHEPTLLGYQDRDEVLRERAERYVLDVVGPHLPMNTIVVDLLIQVDGFRVIEVNPFGLSDPVGAQSYESIMQGIPGISRHNANRASSKANRERAKR